MARRVAAGVAIAVSVGWVALVLAVALSRDKTFVPVDWLALVPVLASVPILAGIAWLLLLRTSQAEARRFGHAAEAMRAEAAALEERVAALSQTLDAHRAHLAQQVEQLATIGDGAGERLLAIGRGIVEQVKEADGHSRQLSDAAASAQASVGVLLASLPRAHGDTQELTRALAATGEVAHAGVETLAERLLTLAERGRDAEASTGAAAGTLAAHMADVARSRDLAADRLEEVAGTMAATVDTLLGRTADTLDEARRSIELQGEAMVAMVSAHQATLDAAARTSADVLAERIDGVEAAIERFAERLDRQRVDGEAMIAGMEAGLHRAGAQMDALHDQGIERSQMLAASISALGGSADAMTEALRAGDAMATRTIGTTETLLIALDSARARDRRDVARRACPARRPYRPEQVGGGAGQARASRPRHRGGKHP